MRTKKKRLFFLLMIAAALFFMICNAHDGSGRRTPQLFDLTVNFHGKEGLSGFFESMAGTEDDAKETGESGTMESEAAGNEAVGSETPEEDAKEGLDHRKIRVLLNNQSFTSFYHAKLQVTSSKPFLVRQNGKETKYGAGEKVTLQADGFSSGDGQAEIIPAQKGRLKVLSFMRMGRHPSYRGMLRIRKGKKGLLLVNELSLGEYLYAVVSSEISSSVPIEALKAQAVCARTYAANRKKASEYEKYGADIDDSDACQVYNNIPEDKNTRRAVKETADLVLKKDGKRIPVYYFSTSWGYTASGKEVWNTEEQIPYLKQKFQITEQSERVLGKKMSPDLSGEEVFRLFLEKNMIRDKDTGALHSFETYDSSSPWFRWQIMIPWTQLAGRIEEKIKACYEAYPNLVFFQKKSGEFARGAYRTFGTLKRIYPGKRDSSGLVTELILAGSKSTVMIRTQYSIRRLLSVSDEKILLMDGNTHTAMRLLPSAAFYLEKHGKGKDAYLLIKGGGFGHGTGMSQWGAGVQAESGWSFQRILRYYFAGITIGR